MNFYSVIRILCFSLSLCTITSKGWSQEDNTSYSIADTVLAKFFFNEAKALVEINRYDEALEKAEKSKEIYISTIGEMQSEVGDAWYLIGRIYYKKREYEHAIGSWEMSANIFSTALGKASPQLAKVYNSLGIACEMVSDQKKAIVYHLSSLELKKSVFGENSIEVADSYNNLGNTYFYGVGDVDLASYYYNRSLEIQLGITGEDHLNVPMCYQNLGVCYLAKNDNIRAVYSIEKAQSIYNRLLGKKNEFLFPTYQNLGAIYFNMGDYSKAVEFSKQSLLLLDEWLIHHHSDPGGPQSNLGLLYIQTGDFELARKYLEDALNARMEGLGEGHLSIADSYVNLSILYGAIGELDKKIEFLNRALNIYLANDNGNHMNVVAIYFNLGTFFFQKRDFENAYHYFTIASNLALSLLGEKHSQVGQIYTALGRLYEEQKLRDKSFENFSLALESLNFKDVDSLQSVSSIPQLISTLDIIAGFYARQYLLTQDENFLRKSYWFNKLNINALDYQFRTISPSSKSILAGSAKDIYVDATNTNYLLYMETDSLNYLKESFAFAERTKGYILYEAIHESYAIKFADIPDSLLQEEYQLRTDIAYQDQMRQEKIAEGYHESDSTLLVINDKLFDLNRAHDALKHHFESDYPQYYKAKYDLSAVPVSYVQDSLLQAGQSLVEYLVGDSVVYIFLIQKDYFEVQEVRLDFPLKQWVSDLTTNGIYGYYTLPLEQQTSKREAETIRNYTRASQQLYDKLLRPLEDRLTEQVIIIPDEVLGYVPFEALLTKQPPREGAFEYYDFVLNEHQISYCYSATLLKEMRDERRREVPSKGLLAMAPFFKGDTIYLHACIDSTGLLAGLRDSLGPIPFSGEEVATIAKNWKGVSLYGPEASIEKFRELAPHFRIIHLSTHGQADDRQGDYAYLAFARPGEPDAFDKLYARDLYNLSLNAEMVVLSACETGIGKLRKGEGIVSLARAFAYAGASSIFTTLWKVSDESTKELTVRFYRHLKAGKPKDEALRQAKLDYLKQNRGKGEASHPFFWAGMIGIGDMRNE